MYTQNSLPTDGTVGPFPIGFNYQNGASIVATVTDDGVLNPVDAPFTFAGTKSDTQPSGATISLLTAVPAGKVLVIRKVIDLDTPVLVWNQGAELSQRNLRASSTNLMEMAQAAYDLAQSASAVAALTGDYATAAQAHAAAAEASRLGAEDAETLAALDAAQADTAAAAAALSEAAAAAHAAAADAARIAAEAAAAGGVATITAAGTTLTVGGTATDPTLQLNLASKNTWDAQQTPKSGALTDAATITWDADVHGQTVTVTLGGARTFAFPTNIVAHTLYILTVNCNGFVPSWSTSFRWPGGVVPTDLTGDCVFTFLATGSGTGLRCIGIQSDVKVAA